MISYTVLFKGQTILALGQEYLSQASCIEMRSNQYDTDTFAHESVIHK